MATQKETGKSIRLSVIKMLAQIPMNPDSPMAKKRHATFSDRLLYHPDPEIVLATISAMDTNLGENQGWTAELESKLYTRWKQIGKQSWYLPTRKHISDSLSSLLAKYASEGTITKMDDSLHQTSFKQSNGISFGKKLAEAGRKDLAKSVLLGWVEKSDNESIRIEAALELAQMGEAEAARDAFVKIINGTGELNYGTHGKIVSLGDDSTAILSALVANAKKSTDNARDIIDTLKRLNPHPMRSWQAIQFLVNEVNKLEKTPHKSDGYLYPQQPRWRQERVANEAILALGLISPNYSHVRNAIESYLKNNDDLSSWDIADARKALEQIKRPWSERKQEAPKGRLK